MDSSSTAYVNPSVVMPALVREEVYPTHELTDDPEGLYEELLATDPRLLAKRLKVNRWLLMLTRKEKNAKCIIFFRTFWAAFPTRTRSQRTLLSSCCCVVEDRFPCVLFVLRLSLALGTLQFVGGSTM